MDKIIKSIEIQLGNATAKVTPEEAKKLYEALGSLLGETKVEYIPSFIPYQPLWLYSTNRVQVGNMNLTYANGNCNVKNLGIHTLQ